VEGWRTTDSTRDEKLPLVFGANPFQLDFLDVATRRLSPLLVHSTFSLMHASRQTWRRQVAGQRTVKRRC
jgi:hypothetical protein